MAKGTRQPHDNRKPVWPYPQHGKLTAHPNGQWVKKVKGELVYFGPWSDPSGALQRWLTFASKHVGQTPDPPTSDITLDYAVNNYLGCRLVDVEAGRLGWQMYGEYHQISRLIIETLGRETLVGDIQPANFRQLLEKLPGGTYRKACGVVWVRTIFRWITNEYGVAPRFGHDFRRPSKKMARQATKAKLIARGAILQAVDAAGPTVKACILLGINGGFGEWDCAQLRNDEIAAGVIHCRRSKTGVLRMVPLWPETAKAIASARSAGDLTFRTKNGLPVAHLCKRTGPDGRPRAAKCYSISLALRRMKCPWTFYQLRHTFRSVADECGDVNAIRLVMGHAVPGVEEHYVHVHEQRARKVTDFVRAWLFGDEGNLKMSAFGSN